ncbi:MAG: hypothetical protein JO244_13425 [Solirubrobacterales bacterium]|nr:hypothetical protein [Solirubrobacterales bacterium]
MFSKIRMAVLTASSSLALFAVMAPGAHAGLLSLTTGSCGQQESQPFAPADTNYYVLVPGGSFEAGSPSWLLTGRAKVVTGSAHDGSRSLSLPAGSTATSPPACTGIDHPSARLFVRNTGSQSSHLNVWATYRLVLGLPYTVYLGQLSGSDSWQPSSVLQMGLLNNVVGSVTLTKSVVSFTFAPADNTGSWSIDDVYLDPYHRM